MINFFLRRNKCTLKKEYANGKCVLSYTFNLGKDRCTKWNKAELNDSRHEKGEDAEARRGINDKVKKTAILEISDQKKKMTDRISAQDLSLTGG